MGRTLPAALAVLMLMAPPAPADPVAPLGAPRAQDVALAGREVMVARVDQRGSVAVDAVALDGGGVRRVLALPSPRRGWSAAVRLSASAERVAVLVERGSEEGHPPDWRLYAGPPAGPLALALRTAWKPSGFWLPMGFDVDADRVAISELRLPRFRATRARVLAPGQAPAPIVWPGRVIDAIALAGDRVAFLGSTRPGRRARLDRILVVDRHTGAVAATLPVGDPDELAEDSLDLAADGRVIAAVDGRLLTIAPGEAVRTLAADDRFASPRFAGARIAALRQGRHGAGRPVALGPAGPLPLGPASVGIHALEANEHGAAWLVDGCLRHAPLDGGPQTALPTPRCPSAEVLVEEAERVLRGRRLRIAVTCVTAPPTGCRGTVRLRRESPRRTSGPVVGRGAFQVPAGRRRMIDAVLTRRAARRVRTWLRAHRGPHDSLLLTFDARVRDGRVGNPGSTAGVSRIARRP